MNRWDTFTFRVSQDERRLIAVLAEGLRRSQSDAVRFVVVSAAREMATQATPASISPRDAPDIQPQGVNDID